MDIYVRNTERATTYRINNIICYRYKYRAEYFYITDKGLKRVFARELAEKHPIILSVLKMVSGTRKWRGI